MWLCWVRRVLFVTLCCGLPVWAQQRVVAASCRESLQRAASSLQQHQVPQALARLQALPSGCQTSDSWNLLGVADGMSGHQEQAIADFEHAIRLNEKAVSPRLNLAMSLLQSGQEQRGIQQLEQVIQLDPAQPEANLNLGLYYANAGRCDQVDEVVQRLGAHLGETVQRSPQLQAAMVHCLLQAGKVAQVAALLSGLGRHVSAALRFTLASELASAGQTRLALAQLKQIDAAESDAAVDFNRGMLESRLGQFDQARRDYFASIDRQPGNAMAYFHIGMDYADAGNRAFAIAWLMKAHQMAPADPEVATGLAELLIQANYFDTATHILAGFTGATASPLTTLARGDLLLAKKQFAGAAEQYRQAMQMASQLTAAVAGHARAEAELGQAEAARKELEAALRAHPQDPLLEAELGHLELAAHDLQPALAHLKDAWKAHPRDARLGFDEANALLLSGQAGAALSVLHSLQGQEGNAKYHLELSQVYRALHRPADMQAELAQMRRINQRQQEDLHFVPPSTYIQ